jgi:hypothetical protein
MLLLMKVSEGGTQLYQDIPYDLLFDLLLLLALGEDEIGE